MSSPRFRENNTFFLKIHPTGFPADSSRLQEPNGYRIEVRTLHGKVASLPSEPWKAFLLSVIQAEHYFHVKS